MSLVASTPEPMPSPRTPTAMSAAAARCLAESSMIREKNIDGRLQPRSNLAETCRVTVCGPRPLLRLKFLLAWQWGFVEVAVYQARSSLARRCALVAIVAQVVLDLTLTAIRLAHPFVRGYGVASGVVSAHGQNVVSAFDALTSGMILKLRGVMERMLYHKRVRGLLAETDKEWAGRTGAAHAVTVEGRATSLFRDAFRTGGSITGSAW